jgi:hypothetical protein
MKKNAIKNIAARMLLLGMLLPAGLQAQTDSTKTDSVQTTEAPAAEQPAAEEPELIAPSLTFACVQKGNNTIDLNAALKAKVKGNFIKLPHLKVRFIQVIGEAEKELGFAITNGEGKASLAIKDSVAAAADGSLHFKALFAGNKAMETAEEELTVKKARLEITPVKEDSLLTVKLRLVEIAGGKESPVKETELGVFVQRSFLPMKIATATTDENGEATVEIPNNLPGDAKGNITLLAKLDENEVYGNLESGVARQWGIPVSTVIKEQPRALWSPHPPLWMLITFIVLMTVVWGHFFVIVYQLWRLRKEEPHAAV